MKESDLQKVVCQYLELRQICFWRNYIGPIIRHNGIMTKNPMAGLPDIIGVLKNGRMFAIELKSQKGRLSEAQKKWIAMLVANNVICIVATSLNDVMSVFEGLNGRNSC